MLSARGLACVRGDRLLFKQLGFSLHPGELLSVAGDNGSGKTSLLRILAGLMTPTQGQVLWNGSPVRSQAAQFRRTLHFLGHLNGLKDDLDLLENLVSAARIAGEPVVADQVLPVIRDLGLERCLGLPVRHLSQGQRRRAALARLTVVRRPLWILDEPFAALDSASIGVSRQMIEAHLARGGMAVLTTHQAVPIAAAQVHQIGLVAA
jgi:heme exporter protein A